MATAGGHTKHYPHEPTDLDRMAERLQREIEAQEGAIYSAQVIEEARHPTHVGRIAEPDGYGRVRSWCGDMMEIYLRLNGGRIVETKFMTDGCGPTLASGNMVARLAEGKTLEEAGAITPQGVIEALGGLPEGNVHCAELAVMTLQNAIFNWRFEHQDEGGQLGD